MSLPKQIPTPIEAATRAFRQSLLSFVEKEPSFNDESLTNEGVTAFCDALEQAASEGCRAGLKEMIESHETDEEYIVHDDKNHYFKRVSSKPFLTRFGVVEIDRRTYYHYTGGPGIVPLDEQWNMQGRYAMSDVAEYILFLSAMLTPKEVESVFAKINMFTPSDSLIQDIINEDGQALNQFIHHPDYADQARRINPPDEPVDALVISADGANLHVREKGHKKGARTKRPGSENNQGKPIEKSSSYKNAMIGSISFYNIVENVIDLETGQAQDLPNRIESYYVGRMPEEKFPTFRRDFENSVKQAESSVDGDVTKILLMDGALGLWGYADETPLFDDYIKVVDYFHAAEHLSRLAESLFGKQKEEAQKWYEKWCSKIKHEPLAVDAMLRSADRYRGEQRLSEKRAKAIETELTFFKRNKHRMFYSELVADGLPIGSGPVEAACKTIVKSRFCQSGMRWSIAGGQNVMNLRVIQKSNQWEETWESFQKTGGYQTHINLSLIHI